MKLKVEFNIRVFVIGLSLGVALIILNEAFGTSELFLLFIYILFYIIYIGNFIRRAKYVASLLNDKNDVDLFLKEVEKDIKKSNKGRYRTMLLINKSSGLIYKGDFQASLDLLETVDIKRITKKIFKKLYYTNILHSLLMLDRIDEARNIARSYSRDLQMETKHIILNSASKYVLAAYEYYMDNLQKSRNMLEELFEKESLEKNKIYAYYFLGLIDLKEGKIEDGKIKIKKASEFDSDYCIVKKAKEVLLKYE